MAKKKSGNAATSWVPSEFKKSDLTRAQRDGFLIGGEQVDGWRVVDDDDYNQSVGNPKRKV
jgi:hypothetical protein